MSVASAGVRQGKRAYPLLVLTLLVSLLFVLAQSPSVAAASGYQTIGLVGKKIKQSGSSSITVYRPEAASPGDVAVATVTKICTTQQPTAPSGWTLLDQTKQPLFSCNYNWVATFYRVIGNDEPVSYTFGGGDATLFVYHGADSSNPIADHAIYSQASGGTPLTAPTVTADQDGERVLHTYRWGCPSGAYTLSSPQTDQGSLRINADNAKLIASDETANAGSVSGRTVSASGCTPAGPEFATSIVLRPAATASPPTLGAGLAVPTFAGASSNYVYNVAQVPISNPTGTEPGDLLLAQVRVEATTVGSITTPSGWTQIDQRSYNEYCNCRVNADALFYKVVGANDPGGLTFTAANTSGYPAWEVELAAYRGVNQVNPIAGYSLQPTADQDVTTSQTAQGFFATHLNDRLVALFDSYGSSPPTTVFTFPTGWTQQIGLHNNVDNENMVIADEAFAAGGWTGALTVPVSNAETYNQAFAGLVALAPGKVAQASWRYGGSNAAAPGLCNCQQMSGDPVDSENGAFSETYTDAKVATYGPSLDFTRTYDSSLAEAEAASGTPGPLGYGWSDDWDMSLSDDSGTVTISQGNGAVVGFQAPSGGACSSPYVGSGPAGTYCALPDVTASLTYDASSGNYTFITHPYQSYTFNSSGQLTGESGPGGATLSLAYNTPAPGSGNCPSNAASCMTVASASGRTLVIGSDSSGRVTSVTDPLGHGWIYAYCSPPSSTCSSGDLVSVTDPRGKVTSYTYDQGNSSPSLSHDLLTVTRPNAQPGGPDAGNSLVNVYNSSGQVSSQTDPTGNKTTFDYSNLDSSGTGYTLVTDPDGNTTQYSYNNGVLVGRTLGYGGSSPSAWSYHPDAATLLDTRINDPNGNETDYTYNSDGDLTSKTNPFGAVWSYSYNSFDEQTCASLPLAANQCASLSPPAAIPAGSSTISPPSAAPPKYVTYSEYDTNGNPIWTTTGDYNPGNNSASESRTTYQLYSNQSVTLGGNNDSCNASAPNSSLPCARIDPNRVVTQLGYTGSGDLTSSSTPDGNAGGELATRTYDYYGDGALKSVTAPNGNLAGANAATYTTTYVYNNDDQLQSKTVSQTGGGITVRTTSYSYDGNGNQISVTDPRNNETDYKYTADDQLALVTDPDNQQTLTCYDGDGQIAETVPAVGVAVNSLTPASCPASYPSGYGDRLASDATTYSYDPLGDRTTITTPAPSGQSGHETTTNAYDPGGRLTSTTAPPASNDANAPNQVTAYNYDDADELTSVTKGSGTSAASTTSYCYDPNGDKTASVAPDGNTSGIANCASSAPYQTNSDYQTGYSYDSLGELVSETRPATAAAPSGQTTSYSYDPAGNELTSQDPNGVTTSGTYTPLNQLATVGYSGSSAHSVSYGYDANGNRVSMSDASGNSTYAYDPFNELTSSHNGAGQTLTYTYNDDGETSGITYPLGTGASWATSDTISYGYDNADELNSITDFNGNTITIGNTADGLPNSLSLGSSGDTISTTYDPTDTPSEISLGNGTSTLLDLAYSDVPSGAISSETTTPTTSTSPAAYDYDAQNRVTQMTPGSGSALNYAFDASGNLTTLPTGASGTYDHASELTSSTLGGTTTNYTYDSDGERLQASEGGTTTASATYNGAQELTSYSNSAANMSAATYDGDGLRTSSTTTPAGGSATTQTYLWDTSSPTPRLVMDSTNAYIYGSGTAPIEQVNLNDGTITYLVADRLGSVRATVNASGTLTNTTSYDAWGNPQTTGGLTSSTPFGYAGNYTDPTSLTYNIRRYYDPQTGQFVTVDPLVDETQAPYSYADDEPVTQSDPTGLMVWGPGSNEPSTTDSETTCASGPTSLQSAALLPTGGSFPYNSGQKGGQPIKLPGGQGYRDRYGNVWKWDPQKQEWDVTHRDGSHTNVGPDGEITHGPNNFPAQPKAPRSGGESDASGSSTTTKAVVIVGGGAVVVGAILLAPETGGLSLAAIAGL